MELIKKYNKQIDEIRNKICDIIENNKELINLSEIQLKEKWQQNIVDIINPLEIVDHYLDIMMVSPNFHCMLYLKFFNEKGFICIEILSTSESTTFNEIVSSLNND